MINNAFLPHNTQVIPFSPNDIFGNFSNHLSKLFASVLGWGFKEYIESLRYAWFTYLTLFKSCSLCGSFRSPYENCPNYNTPSFTTFAALHLFYPIENVGVPQKRVQQQWQWRRSINQLFLSASNQKLPPFSTLLVPDVHQLQRWGRGGLVIWINVTVFKQFPPVTQQNKPKAENWREKLSSGLQSGPRRNWR